jgi:CheY-like chemotaxis protein
LAVREAMNALRILVVEDDALIAMLLADLLTEMGHEICAIEGTEVTAVAAAARCRPHLIIADARLGDESGIAAVDEILCSGPVPHVFISGEPVWVQSLRPGSVVVPKPFREADLTRAMQRALDAAVVAQSENAALE